MPEVIWLLHPLATGCWSISSLTASILRSRRGSPICSDLGLLESKISGESGNEERFEPRSSLTIRLRHRFRHSPPLPHCQVLFDISDIFKSFTKFDAQKLSLNYNLYLGKEKTFEVRKVVVLFITPCAGAHPRFQLILQRCERGRSERGYPDRWLVYNPSLRKKRSESNVQRQANFDQQPFYP